MPPTRCRSANAATPACAGCCRARLHHTAPCLQDCAPVAARTGGPACRRIPLPRAAHHRISLSLPCCLLLDPARLRQVAPWIYKRRGAGRSR
uniref:Uncharacterized protein n=1 Tax=Arundo donax TaxID=35708 RepID=A0A0A8YAX3_ARUDO